MRKIGESQCTHCKNVLEPDEMPEQLKREYESIKSVSKGPVWQFAGLGLIVILIVYGYYENGENKKLELQYLKTPLAGDVYSYKWIFRFYQCHGFRSISASDFGLNRATIPVLFVPL
jgi:hypothetical protein